MSVQLGHLNVSKEILQRILNFLPYPFLVSQLRNGKFHVEFVNERFMQELGYTPADIPTIDEWFKLAYPEEGYRNEVAKGWDEKLSEAAGRKEDSISMQVRIHTKMDRERWYEVKASLWGEVHVVAFIDIDEGKLQESNLRRMNENRDRILSILGHDLRGPLLHVYLLSSMALNDQLTRDEFAKMMNEVNAKAFQTMEFLATTLTWAKSNFDSIHVQFAPVELEKILHETLKLYEPSYAAKELEVTTSIPPGFKLNSDSEIITAVLRNLISNAIKFTPNKGTVRITGIRIDPARVRLEVTDNGVGMDPAKIRQIEEKQYASQVGTQGERGLGIGLALCKTLLASMNSDLQIESSPDKGTTMRVVIREPS